ncbi:MAG: ATP-binding cassette domain-containing protein [Cellulomonas iranensis]|uniref:ABC transporter ATP-binding protein n=1 Tax=Cellulomonas iranensis TaxID=76862 RepID=UPI0013D4DA2E|nr:ATP-binding cassette domain-containing protein [Cellulomonas iranensis]MBO9568259.1 ATP-binding cassette domain-containing protein [Cellulomonas iranensis]UCN15139.1 ATP-binding cassette domain-containing protein [Cellulomonas iranensis]
MRELAMSVGGRRLFDGLTFEVDEGEMVAVVGPSGSGKSTLLAAIADLLPVDSGVVHVRGDVGKASIHWVFQTAALLGRRSVADNVAVVAELRGVPRPVALADARALLGDLGLGDRMSEPAYRLSGGEKQRVVIARALASRSEVVLADEPTAALDAEARRGVVSALRRAADAGAAVVVATHDAWVAQRCTRIVDLADA